MARPHWTSSEAMRSGRRARLGLDNPGAVLHTFPSRADFVAWLTSLDVRELVFLDIAGTGWRLNAGDVSRLMAGGYLLPSSCDWSQVSARCYST